MDASPIRALIVEDDDRFARAVMRLLGSRTEVRFQCHRVGTLAEGLDSLGQKRFDVILLDLGLPDSSGLETLSRTEARADGVPIIVLTGLYDESLAANAFKLGAAEYFHKPDADANSLKRAIRYAMERGSVLQALQENNQRLKSLSRRLVEVQEAERRSIARELHDEVGQLLTAIQVKLEMASRAQRGASPLQECRALLDDLMARVRDLSLKLRPAVLDDLGLLPALLWLFDRYTVQTAISVDFTHSGLNEAERQPELESAAFRIVQEALTNVARHAAVDRVRVRFNRIPASLHFEIEDRGAGFDPGARQGAGGSLGLTGMQERAALLGGTVEIQSSAGAGTRVRAVLPLASPAKRNLV